MTIGNWEYRYANEKYLPGTDGPYEYAIVLGGMTWQDTVSGRTQFLRSGDRLFQAIRLLKKGYVKKLLISGGSGSLSTPNIKEAVHLKKYLNDIGIPDSLLLIEASSDNTYQNAVFSKALLKKENYRSGKILLVTSAAHMNRALACFSKQGMEDLVAFPTDYYTSKFRIELDHCLIPNSEAMMASYVILHEMIGYVSYKIMGYC